MSRQLKALIWVCFLLLVLPAMATQAQTTDVTDEIQVEGWPDPLLLGYGETNEFTITIYNAGDRALGIYLEWTSCECIYGHGGSVSESFLVLDAGESEEVTVTVTSGSSLGGDNDGEGMLRFEWGPNLTMVGGRPDDQTVEDDASLEINIEDDVVASLTLPIAVMAVGVLAAVGAVVIIRMRRGATDGTG
jgi:hypothetical protein